MGIFDFIGKGAQELFIARPDEHKDELVWKWPDETIPMKAQVTVGQDEVALFFQDGKAAGTLPAGRHTLDSQNIPFLSPLLDKVTGGNLFRAQLWFVTVREVADRKFGGSLSVLDPIARLPTRLMVHGEYSLQIITPAAAIGFSGLQSMPGEAAFGGWFSQQVLKVLRDRIGEQLAQGKVRTVFEIAAHTEEIEQLVLEGVRRHVEPYGIQVIRLGNFEVNVDEKDGEMLRDRYQVDSYAGQDVRGFQGYAAAKAMLGAGQGMAKGGSGGGAASEGAGLGIGFGMAQMFQQQAAQQPAPPQPARPQTPAGGPGTVACPKCQAPGTPGKFCGECGTALEVKKAAFCTSCGQPKNPGVKFCSECGAQQG